VTENAAAREDSAVRYIIAAYLVIAGTMLLAFRKLPGGHFQTELDVIRATAARTLAEWLPHVSEAAMMINAPALASSGTLLPGVWLFHVLANLIAGDNPGGQMMFAAFIHMLVAWSTASLAVMLTRDRRAAWAGLIYGIHPVLGDVSATYINGPSIMAMLWIVQAGLCYARFVERGAVGHLFAALLCVFLAASTADIGLFSVFLIAGIEWSMRKKGAPLPWYFRVVAVGLCVASASVFYAVVSMTGMPSAPRQMLTGLNSTIFSYGAFNLLKGMVLPHLFGKAGNAAAVAAGSAIFFAVIYRSLEDVRRLMPVLLLPFAVLFTATLVSDPAFPLPSTGAAFLFPVLLVSLAAGDLFTAIKRQRHLFLLLAALAGYMSMAVTLRLQIPIERGRRVAFVGDELQKIYRDLNDEADIYLVDDMLEQSPLLAGHLDFIYRYGLTRQTRFSILPAGKYFPGGADTLVGRIGQTTRLERTKPMVFVGWNRGRNGLIVLNDLMDEKVREAEDLMSKDGRYTEPFFFGGEDVIANWKVAPGQLPVPKLERSKHRWFVEAFIVRLNPITGRRGFGMMNEE
jgi:hypothetical protein